MARSLSEFVDCRSASARVAANNQDQPHSALGYLSPAAYAAYLTAQAIGCANLIRSAARLYLFGARRQGRQKDCEVRWMVKLSSGPDRTKPAVAIAIPTFGYQRHISIDRGYGSSVNSRRRTLPPMKG